MQCLGGGTLGLALPPFLQRLPAGVSQRAPALGKTQELSFSPRGVALSRLHPTREGFRRLPDAANPAVLGGLQQSTGTKETVRRRKFVPELGAVLCKHPPLLGSRRPPGTGSLVEAKRGPENTHRFFPLSAFPSTPGAGRARLEMARSEARLFFFYALLLGT